MILFEFFMVLAQYYLLFFKQYCAIHIYSMYILYCYILYMLKGYRMIFRLYIEFCIYIQQKLTMTNLEM